MVIVLPHKAILTTIVYYKVIFFYYFMFEKIEELQDFLQEISTNEASIPPLNSKKAHYAKSHVII